jgi:hypothetical protein
MEKQKASDDGLVEVQRRCKVVTVDGVAVYAAVGGKMVLSCGLVRPGDVVRVTADEAATYAKKFCKPGSEKVGSPVASKADTALDPKPKPKPAAKPKPARVPESPQASPERE